MIGTTFTFLFYLCIRKRKTRDEINSFIELNSIKSLLYKLKFYVDMTK